MINQDQAGVATDLKALRLLGVHHGTELGLQAGACGTGMLRAETSSPFAVPHLLEPSASAPVSLDLALAVHLPQPPRK